MTCLNYPFFYFSQCRKSKAIFQAFFQAKIFASRSGPVYPKPGVYPHPQYLKCQNILLRWETNEMQNWISYCAPAYIIRLSSPCLPRQLALHFKEFLSSLLCDAISASFHLPLYHFPLECISVLLLHTMILPEPAN